MPHLGMQYVCAPQRPNGGVVAHSVVTVMVDAMEKARAEQRWISRAEAHRRANMSVFTRIVLVPRSLTIPPLRCAATCAKPLSQSELVRFIRDGFLLLDPTVRGGDSLHRSIYDKAGQLQAKGLCGNNFMCEVPEVAAILDAPEVVGALTTILGEDYVTGASRHCHITKAGSAAQALHQDDFFGFSNYRHAAPVEVMLFYYPQVVTPLMGPTAVIPGSQYSRASAQGGAFGPEGQQQAELPLVLPRAGSCLLMHWHAWHRATAQLGGASVSTRYAFKLQFRRTRPFSAAPTCAQRNPFYGECSADIENVGPRNGIAPSASCHDLRCAAVWAALCGQPLPPKFRVAMRDAGLVDDTLAVASGAWPLEEAVPELLAVTRGSPREAAEGAKLHPRLAEQLRADPRCQAAAALQLCAPGKPGVSVALMASEVSVHPWATDLRLECIGALAALAGPAEALPLLAAELSPCRPPRSQFRACVGIHSAAVRYGAPEAPEWHRAAAAAGLEAALLACLKGLCAFQRGLSQKSAARSAGDDGCRRYALAEALRCVGRCCSEQAACEALSLCAGEGLQAIRVGAPAWRERFAAFVERGRRCPFTSATSPF